jgi:c-di-GMP-binding flagellar brake protein YcgR
MGEEQREFARVPLPLHASCRQHGSLAETWHAVMLLDLSAGGMSFTSEDLFASEGSVEVRIQLPAALEPLTLLGVVRRTKLLGTNFMEYGVEFLDVKPDQQAKIDDLVQFLKKRP